MKRFLSKYFRLILVSIVFFCFGAIITIPFHIDIPTILGGLLTLVTAFFGAYFAFKLNDSKDSRREVLNNVDSANKAIFQVIRAYNFYSGYQKQFIEPFRGSPAVHYQIPPAMGFLDWRLELDYDSLSFLFGKNAGTLLLKLNDLEVLTRTTIESIQTRNHIHVNLVQPKMDAAGIADGLEISLGELDIIIGERIAQTLEKLTIELIRCIDDGVDNSDSLAVEMHEKIKEIYPDEKVIKMDKINND